jgi:hypothetical protein
MIYELVYTDRAKHDLIVATDAIVANAPETAELWFRGFVAVLETLRRDAAVYGLAPENHRCSIEIRQFIYRTKSRRANRALYGFAGQQWLFSRFVVPVKIC